MVKTKVISISHAIDPDGIGAQAIIFRHYRELNVEPIGLLADYHYFKEVLFQAIDLKPTVLIISDLGWNDSYVDIIEPLAKLQARKIWLDHHKILEEYKVMIKEAVDEFIHDTSVCAAELVQQRFMPEDEVSKRIAVIAHNGDFDVEDQLAEMFYTIIDFRRNSIEALEEIREMFASGNFGVEDIQKEYLEAYKAFEADKDRMRATVKVISLGERSIAMAYSALMPRGKVTKFLSEFRDEDIFLAIDTTTGRIGLRSDRCDVAAIAAKLGGGGHKHRSGFTYQNALDSSNELTEQFLQDLEEAIINTRK